MKAIARFDVKPSRAASGLWIVLIVTSGICLSTFFACATPFAALATLAALKLGRREAAVVIGFVWAANQAVGFGFLGYPWTWDCAAWGLAIGVSAGLAMLAAKSLAATRPGPLVISLPFVAAFAAFELSLFFTGFLLPGSEGAFTASIVSHVFLINAVAMCGLLIINQLAMASGLFAHTEVADFGAASYR